MQKKIIALAVAGLMSGAAFAQSNVTIYGVVDQVVQTVRTDVAYTGVNYDTKRNGVDAGLLAGSRIGFRGEEGLGNGLKAVFVLETGILVDAQGTAAGNSGLFGITRQSFVGINSKDFGTVGLGRQYAPGYFAPGAYDGFASATISPQSILSVRGGMTITPNSPARINNSISYTSNAMSGLTVSGIYGFGEPVTGIPGAQLDSDAGNLMGLGATYVTGPISATAVWHQSRSTPAPAASAITPLKSKEWFVGGAYDLKVVKLGASYQVQKGDNSTAGSGDGKDKLWQVSAVAPVGAGTVNFAYGKLKDNENVLNVAAATDNSKSFALAYLHPLSKRTTTYVAFSQTKLDDTNTTLATADTKIKIYGVGLRHTF